MKRLAAALAALCFATLCAAACGSRQQQQTQEPAPSNQASPTGDEAAGAAETVESPDGQQPPEGGGVGTGTDRDGDGQSDETDRCPDEPEDRDGFQDEDGCPEADNDQDGILDIDDRCPADPESKNGRQDEDGCPE